MSIMDSIQSRLGMHKSPAAMLSEETILEALRSVEDPDLHKDIVTLGFVKNIDIKGSKVSFSVELTTPACPVKDLLQEKCEKAVLSLPQVSEVKVEMTAATRGPKITAENVAPSLGEIKNIIAVASGKGGVGKSTTAVNLAFALAKSGSKVGILDADVYGPSIPIMTKVGRPEAMQGQMVVPPEVNGVKIISVAMFGSSKNAAMLRGPMAAQIIKQFLSQVAWGDLDYLVVDYPPGTGDIQLSLSQLAPITGGVVVTTPQEVALIDARKALAMFDTMKVPVIGVIETMSFFEVDGKKHYIFGREGGKKLANEYGMPLLAQIPIDPEVTQGGDQGKPLVTYEESRAARDAYLEAAGSTARQLSILNTQQADQLTQFSLEWQL